MNKKIRVRFAPSPTGALHIGGIRTALYNYLFAKKHKGDFLLRIEDTDRKRNEPKAIEYITESLDWLGIKPNEGYGIGGECGPYIQSERLDIYKEYVQKLLDEKKAYYAFDTEEELNAIRSEYDAQKKVFAYDASIRDSLNNSLKLSSEVIKQKLEKNESYVVRLLISPNQELIVKDKIRGEIVINTNTLDDKVLFKSDGFPTYHLANVVDDYLMKISHVIRGEEWLPSLALHFLLYDAFGWEKPVFAHLPLLLKPEGKGKLSKRDAEKGGFPILPIEFETLEGRMAGFRELGFLPEAVVNFLVFLGWSPSNEQEIFALKDLVEVFSLEQVHKSGARFSFDKAKFFNQEHIKEKEDSFFLEVLKKWSDKNGVSKDDAFHLAVIRMMKPRSVFVHEIWQDGNFFYNAPGSFEEKDLKKAIKENTKDFLLEFSQDIEQILDLNPIEIKKSLEDFVTKKSIGFGQLMLPLRLALSGKNSGPDLFEIVELLGKEESVNRINVFCKELK